MRSNIAHLPRIGLNTAEIGSSVISSMPRKKFDVVHDGHYVTIDDEHYVTTDNEYYTVN